MKKIIIFLAVLIVAGCSRKPLHTYILTFEIEKNTRPGELRIIPLFMRPNGHIIQAANDTIAYRIALHEFYKKRYEEEKSGQKAITTGFEISNPDIKGHGFRYSLMKHNLDKSKGKLFRRNPDLKRFISE